MSRQIQASVVWVVSVGESAEIVSVSGDTRMSRGPLEPVVRSLANLLVQGDYPGAVRYCAKSRLTAADLDEIIRDFGCRLVAPPNVGWKLDAVSVGETERPAWSINAPLWTLEDGESDLTLSLTMVRKDDRWEIELDDLHVL